MPKILVVEDEPAIAESIAYSLRRDGYAAQIVGIVIGSTIKPLIVISICITRPALKLGPD